jgi:hypothetical protein
MEVRLRGSDCRLDCESLLVCEFLAGYSVDNRSSRPSVFMDSSSTELGLVVARLFFGCMVNGVVFEAQTYTVLRLEEKKATYGGILDRHRPMSLSSRSGLDVDSKEG